MGNDFPMFRDAQPVHRVHIDGFFLDKTEVTNEQFERFVQATGYVRVAERIASPEDFPGALRKIRSPADLPDVLHQFMDKKKKKKKKKKKNGCVCCERSIGIMEAMCATDFIMARYHQR